MEKVEICRRLISGSCAGCPNLELVWPMMIGDQNLTLVEAMRRISRKNCSPETGMHLPIGSKLSALGRRR